MTEIEQTFDHFYDFNKNQLTQLIKYARSAIDVLQINRKICSLADLYNALNIAHEFIEEISSYCADTTHGQSIDVDERVSYYVCTIYMYIFHSLIPMPPRSSDGFYINLGETSESEHMHLVFLEYRSIHHDITMKRMSRREKAKQLIERYEKLRKELALHLQLTHS